MVRSMTYLDYLKKKGLYGEVDGILGLFKIRFKAT
jgi:hypothetical protein